MKLIAFLAATFFTASPAPPQKPQTPAGEAPGPWLLGTIGVGKLADGTMQTTALKGLAIKIGAHGEAAVCYDLDLCRLAGAWTGGKFTTPMNLLSRGEYPTALGDVAFTTPLVAGFVSGEAKEPWRDPRPAPFGPLPLGQARFRGFYVHGDKTILKWEIGGKEVLEMPQWEGGKVVRSIEGEVPPTGLEGVFIQPTKDLRRLTAGGPARWPESVVTQGVLSSDKDAAYVVDTIKLPETNPWNAPMFVGGFDFFRDGRAAVCTFHGDVFIVSGIDEKLEQVTWRRFASGLYHALGLKIVKGEIYVTCRDGLWRLQDLNGDGECDFYEAFNHDIMVTKSFHEFVFDLQTDPQGNFYFAKGGPVKNGGHGFDEICKHHGSLLRVSPDGARMSVSATGFRAPNGIGCGPGGELTTGDNEGTWTPACKINWLKEGGFYGVVDLAQRTPPPPDYDRPLCWLPKRVDNSGGSQVWATSAKWGPWRDQLLHLSYGRCALYGVLKEEVQIPDAPDCCDRQMQGGVVKFPLKFESGIMRARFNPRDGQLYVAGLRGWQTSGVKNGCLQRVRYTGAPVRMPLALRAKKGGIEIEFSCALEAKSAADVGNWNIEVWNYLWSSAYGSPEISTLAVHGEPTEFDKNGVPQFSKEQKAKTQHDPLAVKAVRLGADGKSVFLEIPDLKPVMQMAIRYQLGAADGAEVSGEIVNTIHAFGE